jgi:signal transduction histidine kinase
MLQVQTNVTTIIIAVILMLVILSVFVLVLILYFNNKRLASIREKEFLKKEHAQAILSAQLEVQEQTMRQISQEIHDNVGQILSLVNLNLKTLKLGDSEKLETTSGLVNKAIGDLRALSKNLNPDAITKAGLIQLIRNDLEQMQKTGQFITELNVADEPVLTSSKLTVMYRMIQEVLNNIIKHADATNIAISIAASEISITDNGKGFEPDEKHSIGLGLRNLEQRAKMIGAGVCINSTINKGTCVIFSLNKS